MFNGGIEWRGDLFTKPSQRHTHDYTMLKEKFPPEEAWFEFLQVLVDSGYQGILTDYVGDEIQVPHKKPRKSKKNKEQL